MTTYSVEVYNDMGHLTITPNDLPRPIHEFVQQKIDLCLDRATDLATRSCTLYILKPGLQIKQSFFVDPDTINITFDVNDYDPFRNVLVNSLANEQSVASCSFMRGVSSIKPTPDTTQQMLDFVKIFENPLSIRVKGSCHSATNSVQLSSKFEIYVGVLSSTEDELAKLPNRVLTSVSCVVDNTESCSLNIEEHIVHISSSLPVKYFTKLMEFCKTYRIGEIKICHHSPYSFSLKDVLAAAQSS